MYFFFPSDLPVYFFSYQTLLCISFPTAPFPGPHNLSEKSDVAQSVRLAITDMEINSPRHIMGVSHSW